MAAWTPIQGVRFTADGAVTNGKYFAGIQITTNGTASTTYVRHGTTVGADILFTYTIEAVTAGTSRLFPMPGLVMMPNGIYIDIDGNVTEAVALVG